MSRPLATLLETINTITAILAIMGIAALVALVVAEPSRADGLFFDALVVLVIIAFVNGIIAALTLVRRHIADIRAYEIRKVELLRTIEASNAPPDIAAKK